MNPTIFIRLIILTILCLSVSSCKEDESGFQPNFNSFSVIQRGLTTTVIIEYTVNGAPNDIKEVFFVYDTNPGLTVNSPNKTVSGVIAHQSEITGLKFNTTYYFKAFIETYKYGTIESNELIIKTSGPTFSSFPTEGALGEQITIMGNNLSPLISDYVVKFGEYTATVTEVGRFQNELKVKVPSGLPLLPVKISVTVAGITTISSTNFIAFNIPLITSMSTNRGFKGDFVTVKGKYFHGSQYSNSLFKIGTNYVMAQGIENSDPENTTFFFYLPNIPSGEYEVAVVRGDYAKTWSNKFTVLVYPWEKKANFTGGAIENAVGFSIGDKAYVGLGNNGTVFLTEFREYDMTTDTWTRKADFPGDARDGAVAFAIGNKGYIGCGSKGVFTTLRDFWEYDPATNTWNKLVDFGGTARADAIGISINGKGYIGLGRDAAGLRKDWWEYNPSTKTWTQRSDFPGTERESSTAFSIETKGYVGLGNQNSLKALADFYEYDPATDLWAKKSDYGGGARFEAMSFVIGGHGYVVGGLNSSITQQPDAWKFDPVSNQWTATARMDIARSSGIGLNSPTSGFIMTGIGLTNNRLADVWKFIP